MANNITALKAKNAIAAVQPRQFHQHPSKMRCHRNEKSHCAFAQWPVSSLLKRLVAGSSTTTTTTTKATTTATATTATTAAEAATAAE